jgi:hypothetical protein
VSTPTAFPLQLPYVNLYSSMAQVAANTGAVLALTAGLCEPSSCAAWPSQVWGMGCGEQLAAHLPSKG